MATLVRTVVLACAKPRRADLGAVVEVLAGRGNAVEVVSGIEANPLPWEQAVARIGSNAIYVVCGDDVLTLEKIAGLRAALQRGNVPLKNIWAGPINWAEPVQVLRHADQLLRMANGTMPQPPSEASGRTVLPPPAPPPRTVVPAMPTIAAAPPPTNPTPTPTMSSANEPPLVVEGLGNRKPLLFVGAGVLLTGVIFAAVMIAGGDDEEPAKVAAATTTAKETPKKKDAPAKPKVEEAAKPEPAATPEAAVAPDEAEPSPSPSPEPTKAAKAEPEPEVAVAVDTAATPSSSLDGGPAPGYFGNDPVVAEALRSQQIRALDILLISPEASVRKKKKWKLARLRFADAERHCSEAVVAGVSGWRLPNIGELRSLTTANILGRNATYWSDTKGDTYGNTRVIWAVRSHRMHSIGASNRGARTICVRDAV